MAFSSYDSVLFNDFSYHSWYRSHFLELLCGINSPDFRSNGYDLSRKGDFMEELVSGTFGWQNLRQEQSFGKTVHRNILISMVTVGIEGGGLVFILQSCFSAPRTPLDSRSKDELAGSCPVFLRTSQLSPSTWRPPFPILCEWALDYKCFCKCE